VYDQLSPTRLSARERSLLDKYGGNIAGFAPYLSGIRSLPIPGYAIAGNHEDLALFDELEGRSQSVGGFTFIRHDRCYAVAAGGTSFKVMGLGRILPEGLNPRRRYKPKYVSEAQLERFTEVAKRERPDILLFHEPPLLRRAPKDPGFGSSAIRSAIEAIGTPLVFCGHMHFEYESLIGQSVVRGVGYGAKGRYCVLDSAGGVGWRSTSGGEIAKTSVLSEAEMGRLSPAGSRRRRSR
jgi:Icc-related predicted phosphoesterase